MNSINNSAAIPFCINNSARFLSVAIMFFLMSCTGIHNNKSNTSSSVTTSDSVKEISMKPVDASLLELMPDEYIDWLKSNKGMTYTISENENAMVSVIYQPLQLQAAMGMDGTGMSYEQLLEIKKGFHYFFVECLFKKLSATKNNQQSKYLNLVKNNIHFIKNDRDTIKNIIIEPFLTSILNRPDVLMVLVPDENFGKGLTCSIQNKELGIDEVKINIPEKQFDLFPKLKL